MKRIIIIMFVLIITNSCGKKGSPIIDDKPVENKYYKNKWITKKIIFIVHLFL